MKLTLVFLLILTPIINKWDNMGNQKQAIISTIMMGLVSYQDFEGQQIPGMIQTNLQTLKFYCTFSVINLNRHFH